MGDAKLHVLQAGLRLFDQQLGRGIFELFEPVAKLVIFFVLIVVFIIFDEFSVTCRKLEGLAGDTHMGPPTGDPQLGDLRPANRTGLSGAGKYLELVLVFPLLAESVVV